MNLLNLTTNDYPCSLWQVRQANPNVSFPAEPSDEDLATFGYVNVHPTPQPSYDQRTERVEQGDPTLTENGWQQPWAIRPASDEEIAAYDAANAPQPDWMEFGIDLAINPEISNLYNMVPTAIANGLSIGLNEASKGDPRLFMGLWKKIMETGAISTELLHTIASLAVQHHLPKEFIMGLSGTISAPNEVEVATSTDIVASVDVDNFNNII